MSKYIIDLRPDCKVVQQICVSDDNVGVGARSVELFDALTDEYVKENFKDLLEGEYQRGLDDAWETARKIVCDDELDWNTLLHIFNRSNFEGIFGDFSPSEAIEKLKAYEDEHKIKRGDIVNVKGSCNDDLLGVVTKVWEDNCYIMWGDGSGGAWCKKSVVKTGKHIDVDKFLGGMCDDG